MAVINCPDCSTDISTKAVSCPKCGREIKYWTPGRILIGILIVVVFLGFPSYCLKVTITPTYTPNFAETYSSPEIPRLYNFKMGDTVNLGDKKVTVFGFQPYSESSMKTHYNTSQGIALEVAVENIGDTPFWLNPLQFTVQDNEGRALTYYDVIPGGKSPALHSETIAPGQKIRAFITYADNKKPVVIYYKSLENQTVSFTVEQQANSTTDKTAELFNLLGNKTFDTENGVKEDEENIKALKNLIKSGVDVNAREPQTNSTVLMMSAAFNRPKATRILVEKGADVNAQNNFGQTALMYAAMHNNFEIASLLIERGANVNHQANNGLTAIATLNGKHGNNPNSNKLRQLLEKSGH